MSNPTARRPFVLEIGSEEIPARFTPTAMAELAARLTALLADLHLDHGPLQVLATPRRLAVLCDGLAVGQPDREEEVKGPPVSVAFDPEGNPTRAGEGFARKVGLSLADCGRGEDQRGEYLLVTRTVAGRSAAEVLGEQLPALVLGLPFRKTMRWGDLELEYARPLQWLLCLHGDQVVPFSIGPLTSGRATRGHRTLAADASRDVASADRYLAVVEDLGVMPDPARRRAEILAQAAALLAAEAEPSALRVDDELLDEVVHLCEFPTAFLGRYAAESFELPEEVIVTALKAHQRYFVVEDPATGRLRPRFLAVRDGGREHLDTVTAGNERVLRARLADALFYWRFDQQKSPAEHAAGLANVTWLEGFGSVADQTARAAHLAQFLWRAGLGEGEPPTSLGRAAALSRFDLVTEMIKDGKEFTKLEGVIAARYAAAAGESEAVCRALEESQLPRSAQGALPADRVSRVLSAAWRLDTLAGCWLAGFAPTGAKDPYALRRHTLAVLRIILALEARVDLRVLIREALAPYAAVRAGLDLGRAADELLEFVTVRFAGWLQEAAAADPDVVRAVLPIRGLDPTDARAWITALTGFRGRDDFLRLARGFKRCANILKGDELPDDQRTAALERWRQGGRGAAGESFADLVEPAEVALRDAVVGRVPALLADEGRGDYVAVFQALSALGPGIDRFFDEVRVNTDDPSLTRVRLGFLREVHALFLHFADFSQVAPDDE
ncbi:MAG: glycine--tRNA ligase subunit beta [Candidatus Krumholzibacteriia bacterium]